jgi:hypothetical protein
MTAADGTATVSRAERLAVRLRRLRGSGDEVVSGFVSG